MNMENYFKLLDLLGTNHPPGRYYSCICWYETTCGVWLKLYARNGEWIKQASYPVLFFLFDLMHYTLYH